ncbi:MAG: hypothetical protein JWO52_2150 [Gammaproteobacteria bacterium]|jgi:hypothetical protein|nr:hypothetical protein [Gammaproteobacteria bacterium]
MAIANARVTHGLRAVHEAHVVPARSRGARAWPAAGAQPRGDVARRCALLRTNPGRIGRQRNALG